MDKKDYLIALLLIISIGSISYAMINHPVSQELLGNKYSSVSIKFPVVAISSNGTGVLNYAELDIIPGRGRVLINVNPFVEVDTQYSFYTAVKVASRLARKDPSKYDFILDFNPDVQLVGGPSAGGVIALATYFALTGKKLPDNFAMTGTINPDGTIGPVGGVFEKARAAAEAGKKYFLVPRGQAVMRVYEKKEDVERQGPFVVYKVYYVPVLVNLTQYFKERYNMTIIEVSTLQQAISIVENLSRES